MTTSPSRMSGYDLLFEAAVRQHGLTCFLCGMTHARSETLQVDFVVPLDRGGDASFENAIPACRPCAKRRNRRPLGQYFSQRLVEAEREAAYIRTMTENRHVLNALRTTVQVTAIYEKSADDLEAEERTRQMTELMESLLTFKDDPVVADLSAGKKEAFFDRIESLRPNFHADVMTAGSVDRVVQTYRQWGLDAAAKVRSKPGKSTRAVPESLREREEQLARLLAQVTNREVMRDA